MSYIHNMLMLITFELLTCTWNFMCSFQIVWSFVVCVKWQWVRENQIKYPNKIYLISCSIGTILFQNLIRFDGPLFHKNMMYLKTASDEEIGLFVSTIHPIWKFS